MFSIFALNKGFQIVVFFLNHYEMKILESKIQFQSLFP